MNNTLRITNVNFTIADEHDLRDGLLGYARVELNHGLRLDGLTIRRTVAGRIIVVFPERRDGHGRRHPLIWPLTDAVKREIETSVLDVVRGGEFIR